MSYVACNLKFIDSHLLTRFYFQKLAKLLYQAADDGAYVNPAKVQNILGFTPDQAKADDTPAATSVPDVVPQATSSAANGQATSATSGG